METSKDIIASLFETACNDKNTVIKIVARDQRVLKAWFIAEAVDVYCINPILKHFVRGYNHNTQEFVFHNGSVMMFRTFRHYNDAKSGMQNYLVLDETVSAEIRCQLVMRTADKHWLVNN